MIKRPIPLDKKTAERLSKVRSANTSLERLFKKAIKEYRILGTFRTNKIIGKPDFANRAAKVAVFLDGCFWHGHIKCYKEPRHNKEYWQNKIYMNRKRRIDVRQQLKEKGWLVLSFWECTVKKNARKVARKVGQVVNTRRDLCL